MTLTETAGSAVRSRGRLPLLAGLVAALLVGAALGGVGVAVAGWSIDLRGSTRGPSSDEALLSACHEAVKAKLKAPATARFSHESITEPNPGIAKNVAGDLDSENGFGALIRSQYTCFAYVVDSGWQVQNVKVDGE